MSPILRHCPSAELGDGWRDAAGMNHVNSSGHTVREKGIVKNDIAISSISMNSIQNHGRALILSANRNANRNAAFMNTALNSIIRTMLLGANMLLRYTRNKSRYVR